MIQLDEALAPFAAPSFVLAAAAGHALVRSYRHSTPSSPQTHLLEDALVLQAMEAAGLLRTRVEFSLESIGRAKTHRDGAVDEQQ